MTRSRARTAVVAAVSLLATLGVAAPAEASHVNCGTVLTRSTTLHQDVGPCSGNGITVAANNVTLNLNGHRVFGTNQSGEGAGVLLRHVSGVVVVNGTVEQFDGGVVIEGGARNSVVRVTARDNIGSSEGMSGPSETLYGDGIAVQGSSHNRIIGNHAVNNGPYSGIALYEVPDSDHPTTPANPVTNNVVHGNVVEDNVACREGPFCDNDGIRLEPNVGPDNLVSRNIVRRNGLDGISLFGRTHGNRLVENVVEDNGYDGAVPGDGIRVFGFENLIQGNRSFDNAANGISVGRRSFAPLGSLPAPNGRSNQILRNDTGGNGTFDLHDSNPGCDANVWRGNRYHTANQPCTTA